MTHRLILVIPAIVFAAASGPLEAQDVSPPPESRGIGIERAGSPGNTQSGGVRFSELREAYRRRGGSSTAFRLEYEWDNGSYDDARTEVMAVTLSPEGRFLCTANSNEEKGSTAIGPGAAIPVKKGRFATARLWDLKTGREVRRFVGHEGCFYCTSAAFSPDGKLLATCGHKHDSKWMDSYGEEVRLWDVATGEELYLWDKENIGWTIAFTPDGKRLVVVGYNGVMVIDVPSRKVLHQHRLRRAGYTTPVSCWLRPIPLPDNRSVLVVLGDHVTKIDLESGKTLQTYKGPAEADQFALSHDAKLVAAIGEKGLIVWDARTGQEIRRLEPDRKGALSDGDFVGFTADGQFVMGVTERGDRYVWNLENGKLLQQDKIGPGHFAMSPNGRFLVRGDCAHIDVVETESGIPTARLHQFEEERHWMTETIDGCYAASKEYNRFMALDDRFERAGLKHEPRRVAAVLGVFEETAEPDRAANAERGGRPTVTLSARKVYRDAADIVIVGRSADASITGLHLSVNGRPVAFAGAGQDVTGPERNHEKRYEAKVKFDAPSGKITVTANVVDSQGRRSETAQLEITPASPGTDVRGRLFVLAVGVSKYKYDEYDLHYAHNDATALAKFFRSRRGSMYADVVTQVYTDERATRANLLKGLDWLKKSCTEADGAVVLFSGHGVRGRKGLYFVTHEGDEEAIHYTCLNWSDVASRLSETKARGILLLSDCCHAGAFAGQRLATQEQLARTIREKAEVVFFASCRPDQVSMEESEWQHGAFTLALLEGLQGKADLDRCDGKITLGELDQYVRRRVSDLTKGRQTPMVADFKDSDRGRVIVTTD